MSDVRDIFIGAAIVAVLAAILIFAAGCNKASAEHAPTYRTRAVDWYDRDGERTRYYRRERRTEVRGWHSGHNRWDYSDDQCKGFLAIVGDQYASEQGAQQEADKAWMQTARWQHGERFMSRDHARNASYECGRSSVGSVVGQVFYRCRLNARPCRPEATKGER